MKAIESALAFTKAIGTRSIEVPEWKDENGQPVRIHWTPLTLSERERIFRGSDLKLTSYADVLHLKALDAEGKKMFDLEDKVVLSTAVESGVVQRIALEILRAPSLEDLEKN